MELNIHLWLQDDIVRFLQDYAAFDAKDEKRYYAVEVGQYGSIRVWAYDNKNHLSNYNRTFSIPEALMLYIEHKGVAPEVH